MDPNNPCDSEFVIGRNKTAQVARKKFPLHPAAAKTTHSSQGDNKTRIVENFSTRKIIPHTLCGAPQGDCYRRPIYF